MSSFKIPSSLLIIAIISFLVLATNAQNTNHDFLNTHNQARSLVGVGNVVWDNTVAAYAQNYANARKADCLLVNSNGPYGENLATGSGTLTAVAAVTLWVNEKPYYDHTTNSCIGGHQCLHYRQVVWSSSVKIGCARVQCNNGLWFMTCNYDTPGNYVGQYPY